MMQLSTFLWFCIILFAVIGYLRGYVREFIAAAGIILALFTVVQFDDLFQNLGGGGADQIFYLKSLFVAGVAFFAYQTPPERFVTTKSRGKDARDNWQNGLLGGLVGGINGYLVFGSIWYFMDQLAYPLSPNITTPPPESASAEMVANLPLVWMQEGNFLTFMVIGLFLFILIFVI